MSFYFKPGELSMLRVLIACCVVLASCGGGDDAVAPLCGSASATRISISPGLGAELVLHSIDVPARSAAWTMDIEVDAARLLESRSGISLGPRDAVAAYHFVRLYREDEFWKTLPTTSTDELLLPIARGACVTVTQRHHAQVAIAAGARTRVELVWSIVRPPSSEQDITAITESLVLSAR